MNKFVMSLAITEDRKKYILSPLPYISKMFRSVVYSPLSIIIPFSQREQPHCPALPYFPCMPPLPSHSFWPRRLCNLASMKERRKEGEGKVA